MAYIVPQVLINQLISEVQLNTVKNQNVLVIGPNYELFRFAEEKDKTYLGRFEGGAITDATGETFEAGAVLPYPNSIDGTIPDAGYTKVFADNVVVELVTLTDEVAYLSNVKGKAIVGLQFAYSLTRTAEDSEEAEPVFERDVVPGDMIRITKTGIDPYTSTIVEVFESEPGSGDFDSVRLADAIPTDFISSGVVSGTVSLCAKFSGVEIPKKLEPVENWSTVENVVVGGTDTYGVKFDAYPQVVYTNWGTDNTGREIISADLYVQHRDLIPATATDIATISTSSDAKIAEALGTIHPDNPLAFGVHMAALNSGDRLVYYVGVGTDNLIGYSAALDKASLTDEVYIICPTTTDLAVIQEVEKHCNAMSTKENKLWRIGFVAAEPPKTDMIYDKTNNPSGEDFTCTLAGSVLTFTSKAVRCMSDVQVGDTVKLFLGYQKDIWDDTPGYTEFQVVRIISNTSLQLDEEPVPAPGVDPPYKVEVYRKLDARQQVKYIAAQSSQMASRRMYNVFPSQASTNGVVFDGSFLACAAAGLVSSVLPQQPVTNVTLNGIGDIPIVYQTYSRDELNTIAEGGTFIIMQDRPNAQVYVRHQISTEYTSGNLLKAELSITKNLDSISYYFAEVFSPYIGKYNITPDLLDILRNVLQTGLTALETSTAAGLYGPQVLAEGTEIVYLRQKEANKDHVEGRVHLNLPVPFNYFDLDLEI